MEVAILGQPSTEGAGQPITHRSVPEIERAKKPQMPRDIWSK